MRRIKILYLVSTLRKTGPTRQLFNIIKNLSPQFQPQIITMSPEPPESLFNMFQLNGIPVQSIGLSRIKGLFLAEKRFSKILSSFQPDLIHSSGFRPDCMASQFKGIPKISTLRNILFEDYPLNYGLFKGNIMILIHKQALKKFTTIVACSKSVSDKLKDNSVFTETIQNGVDTTQFYPANYATKQALKQKLGLPGKGTIFISTGHLTTRKDPITIIEGFKKSPINGKSLLIMAGDGSLKNRCMELSSQNKNIIFTGRVSNVREYLQASDIFVSASKAEGLPNAVLEALACGLPVVLSEIEPHREILQNKPLAGLLFSLSNEHNFSECLQNILINNSDRKENAINLIDNYFSAQKMSERYQDLYTNICNK